MAVTAEREYGLHIGGETVEAASGEARELREPATGDLLARAAMAGEADFERLRAAIDVPILANMTEFGKSPLLTVQTLENLGVNVVIYPVTLLRLAMHAADAGLAAIAELGTQEGLLDQMQHRRDLYDLLDYQAYNTFDAAVFNFKL